MNLIGETIKTTLTIYSFSLILPMSLLSISIIDFSIAGNQEPVFPLKYYNEDNLFIFHVKIFIKNLFVFPVSFSHSSS